MNILSVEESENKLSVIEFLQRRIPTASAGYLRQLLKKGKVLGEKGPVKEEDKLSSGDCLRLPDSGRLRELLCVPAPSTDVAILYESREILIVAKPAGIATHAGVGHEEDNLTARVGGLLAQRGDSFRVSPVHRLDLETSGPVLFGKGKHACGELGKLFSRDEVEKFYVALASGKTPGSGELRSPVSAKGKQKEAHTSFRALVRAESASLLELRLHTGRQHQIRKHLADLGYPLYGDRRYGGPCPPELSRVFLHCSRLAFFDPFSKVSLAIESPLPDDLGDFLQLCKIEKPEGF